MSTFLRTVDRITAAGGTVSDEFNTIRRGLAAVSELHTQWPQDAQAALTEAAATGDPQRIREAATTAAAALAWTQQYGVIDDTQKALSARLRAAYKATAADNYRAVSEAYNAAVDSLRDAVDAADITLPAEKVLKATAKARTAWEMAPVHAARVEELAGLLVEAAALAGGKTKHPTHERQTDQVVSVVTREPEAGDPMRTLWRTWDEGADHRGGRFAALAVAGLLDHAPALTEIKPLRRPRGYETNHVRRGHGYVPILHDLETGKKYDAAGVEYTDPEQAPARAYNF